MAAPGVRRSSGQRADMPFPWSAEHGASTIPAVLTQAGRRFAEEPWMAFKGEVQTFADLVRNVATIATGLEALGVAKGDQLEFHLKDRLSPGILRSTGQQNHTYVIMPMRI